MVRVTAQSARRTVVWLQVTVKDLRSPVPPICLRSYTACPSVAAIWMVTVIECEEDLHEVVPDCVFWDCSVVSLGMLDDSA